MVYRFKNRLKCKKLIVIELRVKVVCQVEFVYMVICQLLRNKMVFVDVVPVVTYVRHVNKVG